MEFEDLIGNTLRIGVLASIILLLIGLFMLYYNGLKGDQEFKDIISPNSPINSKLFNFSQIFSFNDISFLYLGLIVLIFTPIIRVILGIVQFYKEKNLIYTIITMIVLINIMISIFLLSIILHIV